MVVQWNHEEINREMSLRLIFVSLLTLLTVSPLTPRYWTVGQAIEEVEVSSMGNVALILPNSQEEMNFGGEFDCVVVENQMVKIKDCDQESGQTFWQSGQTWQVKEAITADLNRDGERELVMLVWRPFKPWPVDSIMPHSGRIESFQDKNGISCHLILVGWDGDSYRELWAGSALVDPIFHIQSVDVDGNGKQELVALEGQYDSIQGTGNLTVWDWNGFGFTIRDRVRGNFATYGIVSTIEDVLIVTE